MTASNPSDAQSQFDLFGIYQRVAIAQQQQKHYGQAIATYDRSLMVLLSLKEQKRLLAANEKWIGITEQAITECRKLKNQSEEK